MKRPTLSENCIRLALSHFFKFLTLPPRSFLPEDPAYLWWQWTYSGDSSLLPRRKICRQNSGHPKTAAPRTVSAIVTRPRTVIYRCSSEVSAGAWMFSHDRMKGSAVVAFKRDLLCNSGVKLSLDFLCMNGHGVITTSCKNANELYSDFVLCQSSIPNWGYRIIRVFRSLLVIIRQ